jgi:group I intron endonuclease
MTLQNELKENLFDFNKSGIYVITCIKNGKHYVGESNNVSARLCAHKNKLKKQIHENKELQQDFNQYGERFFVWQKLLFGYGAIKEKRLELETCILLTLPDDQRYNVYIDWKQRDQQLKKNPFFDKTHTLEARQAQSKAKKGKTSSFSGYSQTNEVKKMLSAINSNQTSKDRRKAVYIDSIYYESISEASQKTGFSRRLIRERCHDNTRFKNYQWVPLLLHPEQKAKEAN